MTRARDELTDLELETAEQLAAEGISESPRVVRKLIAEVRRLRALHRIHSTCPVCQQPWSDIGFEHDGWGRATASLWKHSDGRRCRLALPSLPPPTEP